MHDFFVKRAVDFVTDLLLHSLRAPAKNARHFCLRPDGLVLRVPAAWLADERAINFQ